MKLLALIAFAAAALSGFAGAPEVSRQVLYEAGTNGYFTYRIASMVATKDGTLLAFAAARKGEGGDWDPINIVMRRSVDMGKTWEPLRVIVEDGDLPCDNAMPITDYVTGDIHLLYQIHYERCYYTKSSDDGLTWSEPIDITATLEAFRPTYDWKVIAPGPGHGIQMANGRLVVPFWMSDGSGPKRSKHTPHRPSIVVSVYSDDHGKTWKAGEVALPDNDVFGHPQRNISCPTS